MLVKRMALRTQVEIDAPVERVWGILSALPEWRSFNSFLKVEQAPEKVAPGATLKVAFQPPGASRPTVMAPQVVAWNEGRELRWRGKLWNTDLLFVGEHYFRVEPLGPGRTLLHHGEDFRGCLVPLLGGLLKDTEKGFLDFNAGLKRAAEAGAGAGGGRGPGAAGKQ